MPTERDRMLDILQRLSYWNRAAPLHDPPVKVLKKIVEDAEGLLTEIAKASAQASDASSENPGPSKTGRPGAR